MKPQKKKLSFQQTQAKRALEKEFFNSSYVQEGKACLMQCEYVDKAFKLRNLSFKPDYDKLLSKMSEQEKTLFLENEEFLKGLIQFINQDLMETQELLAQQVSTKFNSISSRFPGESYKKVG